MTRNLNHMLLYQILIHFFWLLTLVSSGFVAIWLLFFFQELREDRRPRFNLKEI